MDDNRREVGNNGREVGNNWREKEIIEMNWKNWTEMKGESQRTGKL